MATTVWSADADEAGNFAHLLLEARILLCRPFSSISRPRKAEASRRGSRRQAETVKIASDPATRELCRAIMPEAQEVGVRLGIDFGIDVDKRVAGAAAVGRHKTSMLQDLERGRKMEINATVTAVQELGRKVGVATPHIDVVFALVRQRAPVTGLYPEIRP